MNGRRLYRKVERMSLDELRHERELLGPLIRDVVAAKQARMRALSRELERREAPNAEATNCSK